jgi:predicted nucleic acid-binding protein
VFEGKFSAVCHYKLLAEYRDVLERMVKAGELVYSRHEVERLLATFITVSEEVEVRYLWRPNLRDEADNFVYELAVAASPSTIVTHNIRDFLKPEIVWPGVFVKTPQQALKEVSKHA